ncbi:aerotolerance regulator BatA [bacterium]|nr:aerotolerance regulator BatA [bacterium]|tara:strand:+ start:2274 stop:3257 length:984 start_codon:yes stop_codon:yes gene_type:complete
MIFANPYWLLCLLPLLFLILFQSRNNLVSTLKFSDVSIFRKIENRSTKYLSQSSRFLRYLILFLMVITLAKPQSVNVEKEIMNKGIDIMMLLDTSGSMAAEDFQPKNRLQVAKETMKNFISKRQSDQIGLVVFGSDAYTQAPLSMDYKIIGNLFNSIELSMAGDGTAIGMAIATGLNRLKSSTSKSKIMVLLTDGENNTGDIDPTRASELARDIGVKIYAIGIGKEGGAKIPYYHPLYGKVYSDTLTYLDEVTLKTIAKNTNGRYFRATDTNSLKDIYEHIDMLEKTKIKSKNYVSYYDYFPSLLMIISILILFELLLFNILFVVIP